MSILRTRPQTKKYRLLLVKPIGNDFDPSNWRQRPQGFTIVSLVESTDRQGKADAWAFQVNQKAIKRGLSGRAWAVVLSGRDTVSIAS